MLGALGGALLGGAIGHNQTRCPDGYYAYDEDTRQYYDNQGQVYQPQGGPGYASPPPPPQPAYNNGYAPPPPPEGGPPPGYDRGPGQGGGPDQGGDFWSSAPRSIRERISYLRSAVQRNADSGRISPRDARRSYADLSDIQRQEMHLRRRDGGHLNDTDRTYLQDRLDRAREILHDQRQRDY